jgi:hypothetical protein
MLVTTLQKNMYRVVLGSAENDTFYFRKNHRGNWLIKQNGITIDFATDYDDALVVIEKLHSEATV